jgi:hypothetical protein
MFATTHAGASVPSTTHAKTSSSAQVDHGWASLLPELVQSIANYVLSTTTGGVGSYMDMRAVCPSWRSSITKPSPLAAIADVRFRPRHWVLVDQKSKDYDYKDDSTLLFFYVLSGRFR